MDYPQEPTAEQCSKKSDMGDGWYALWYPGMGGYVGKAVAHVGECVEVFVWHDGEFPFRGSDDEDGKRPARLHHCDPDQFRNFADDLEDIARRVGVVR